MSNIECPICLDSIDTIDHTITNCKHNFHIICLQTHTFKNGYICPICRANIIEDDLQSLIDRFSFSSEDESVTSNPYEDLYEMYEGMRDVATTYEEYPNLIKVIAYNRGKCYLHDRQTNNVYDWDVYRDVGDFERVGYYNVVSKNIIFR